VGREKRIRGRKAGKGEIRISKAKEGWGGGEETSHDGQENYPQQGK